MIVRKAVAADAKAITGFQLAMAWETENLRLDASTLEAGVEAVFSDPSKGCYYVAETDGQVIASLLTTFEWSDWRNGTVLWVQSVYVLPEHRGTGVYKTMYKYIQSIVEQDQHLKGIRLYAEKTNSAAHQVYEKLGMTAEHYQLYEWLKN
ncbi:GNAT family N-acetyltransferase [Gaoshiqia sp. Z1-71]|uniref:GNAT family N-acetyltransferase n=1 Tax=Gaoshiqia hydrogeniformans TaxID=3290090 RepID=UPI003BF80DC8